MDKNRLSVSIFHGCNSIGRKRAFQALPTVNSERPEITTKYGTGLYGTLRDGTTIIARRGSKSDGPTLEINPSKGKVYKYRY